MKDHYHDDINGRRGKVKLATTLRDAADHVRHLERNAKYRKAHPDRARAKDWIGYAIRKGRYVRLPCQVCGEGPGLARIDDASKPHGVIWLCREHLFERLRLVNRKTPADQWPVEWPMELRKGSSDGMA